MDDQSINSFVTQQGPRVERSGLGVGDVLMGRYTILAELGRGGMGVVYKCFDCVGKVNVALKSLPTELSHNDIEMEDIRENFQLVQNLNHPNIANVKQLERDPLTGMYYLVMECVEGESLRAWMRRMRSRGTLTLEEILPILQQMADALDYAHARKIIHRDIKPGNVMLEADGTVKILDFGLAAQIHTSMTYVSMAYQNVSGTGPYMSPEQWRGKRQGAAADQYALGVLAYELLAGHLPFESADHAVLKQAVLEEKPDPIPTLPASAQVALLRAMAKDATARFESCLAFVNALKGKKVKHAKIRQSKPRASSTTSLRGWKKGALIGACCALLLGACVWAMPDTFRSIATTVLEFVAPTPPTPLQLAAEASYQVYLRDFTTQTNTPQAVQKLIADLRTSPSLPSNWRHMSRDERLMFASGVSVLSCSQALTWLLDEKRYDVNSTGHGSMLHWAILAGQWEVAELLLEKGANPSLLDREGRAPLSWAIASEQPLQAIQFLIQRGARVDKTSAGRHLLHDILVYAAPEQTLALVNWALEHQTLEMNLRDKDGNTPLALLAQQATKWPSATRLELLNTLLLHAADKTIANKKQQRPIDLAATEDVRAALALEAKPGYRVEGIHLLWTPGAAHTKFAHIHAGDEENTWLPDHGWEWVDPRQRSSAVRLKPGYQEVDGRTVWKANLRHSTIPQLTTDTREGEWLLDEGWTWRNRSQGLEVELLPGYRAVGDRAVWTEGLRHPEIPQLTSCDEQGRWSPDTGWRFKDGRGDSLAIEPQPGYRDSYGVAVWTKGLRHPDYPHITSSKDEGYWNADDGYKFLSKNSLVVQWEAYRSLGENRRSGATEGVFQRKVNCSDCDRGTITKRCSTCSGSGKISTTKDCSRCRNGQMECPDCEGMGYEPCDYEWNMLLGMVERTCSEMNGRCPGCNSSGRCGGCKGRGSPPSYGGGISIPCFVCSGSGTCSYCHGRGVCNECGGSARKNCSNYRCRNGRVECTKCDGRGSVTSTSTCRVCDGRGSTQRSCTRCSSTGYLWVDE